jgi:ribosomal protein S18 acetylase RimI-like enzyme
MENNLEKQALKSPRLVLESDWEKSRDFYIRAVTDTPQAFRDTVTVVENRPEEEWKRWANNSYQFVVEENGSFVANVTLRKDVGGVWMISGVWTDPAFRGQGLSTKLIEAALLKASELGVSYIELNVNAEQADAIKLYRRMGFVEKRRNEAHLYSDGKKYESIVMGIEPSALLT